MSPSDKNKSTENSVSKEGQTPECSKSSKMEFSAQLASSSTSDVTIPGHGMIANIPLITASLPTLECSINDQMKTFDPGDSSFKRLTNNPCGNSSFQGKNNSSSISNNSSSLIKNSSKNYKAGSKINKLADMLAKRSQNVVEVTQNNTINIITDIISVPKVNDTVVSSNVSNATYLEKNVGSPVACYEKTGNDKKLDLFRKSRRKSVPNQSCNTQQLQLQSMSKSCSDFSRLFPVEENDTPEINALGGSLTKVQTDESTKKKVVRKNLKNVELPLILPERKRRSSMRNEVLVSNKLDKNLNSSGPIEILNNSVEILAETSSKLSPLSSISSTKVRKESRLKQKKSKKLVETSTQTADIEFISVLKQKPETIEKKLVTETNEKPLLVYECLYCTATFALSSECKAHEKMHSPKNNKQIIKCQYCSKKLPSLDELKSHCIHKHPNKYAYCMKCDERFVTKDELYAHNKEIHLNKSEEVCQNTIKDESPIMEGSKQDIEEKQTEKKLNKQNGAKTDLKIDVSYDSSKKSSVSPRNVQKVSPKTEPKTDEQLLEMEMLFYSHLSGNIQENLNNHLDGKIDKSGNPVRTDQINEPTDISKNNSLLSVDTPSTGTPDVQVSRAPSPYQTRSKTPNPLPPTAKKFKKLPNWQQKFWEKYNFPTNYRYEHRFWDKNYLNTEKSPFYLKDLSLLDIKTQLTMRDNIKKLDEIKLLEENSKPVDKLKFPNYLSLIPKVDFTNNQEKLDPQKNNLDQSKNRKQTRKEEIKKSFKSPCPESTTGKCRRKLSADNSAKKPVERSNGDGPKMMTRRQSSVDLTKDIRKRKGSLDSSSNQRMTLRRQTSLDSLQNDNESNVEKSDKICELSVSEIDVESSPLSPTNSTQISGEWVRPRSYLCGTCCAKFTNLWELEDHKWVSHPNVWCTHYEFEDEKIDKLFPKNENEDKESDSTDSSTLTKLKLTDLYKRYLLPHGSLKTAKLVPNTSFPEQCTKCKKSCMNLSEMHKHMLDCGGDTTWFLTMYSSPMTIKRRWRPFGSRRKKQIGRRDLKRNIPNTPTLRPYHYPHRIRTKPGDVESIQKMLANLPEKRARRAINFDDIKTRSQATIHSNRLLRKRFKSSFANNLLKLKNLRQKSQMKQRKKEGSSKSATDTSSENTPVGSPKRKHKIKDALRLVKEENLKDTSSENLKDLENQSLKKKTSSKRKEPLVGNSQKPDKPDIKIEKPMTRSNSLLSISPTNQWKKNSLQTKEEVTPLRIICEESNYGGLRTEISKTTKKEKKKVKSKVVESEKVHELLKLASEANTRDGVISDKKSKLDSADSTGNESLNKKKSQFNLQRNNSETKVSLLKFKQNNKEKTEMLKRMKKKLDNSKKILEMKEVKNAENGSRRSLRLKCQQKGTEISEVVEAGKEENNCQKVITIKNSGEFLENIKKPVKILSEKIITTIEQKNQPLNEDAALEKKLSRNLKNLNSPEEKLEVTASGGEDLEASQSTKKIIVLRPRSKSFTGNNDTTHTDVLDKALHKKPRVVNIQDDKIIDEKQDSVVVNGQISLLKTNRLPRYSPRVNVKVEKPSGSCVSNDLAEMPILAKVEPIKGKTCEKTEEIPILSPVENNQTDESAKDQSFVVDSTVKFKVIKKRKKTSEQITPLKIVKKIENTSRENESNSSLFGQAENNKDSCLVNTWDLKKNKEKEMLDSSLTEKEEKKSAADVKKYFLGICPSEIDKGRAKDSVEESNSDNEPLITLIVNQSQKDENTQLKPEVSHPEKEKSLERCEIDLKPKEDLAKIKIVRKNKKTNKSIEKMTKSSEKNFFSVNTTPVSLGKEFTVEKCQVSEEETETQPSEISGENKTVGTVINKETNVEVISKIETKIMTNKNGAEKEIAENKAQDDFEKIKSIISNSNIKTGKKQKNFPKRIIQPLKMSVTLKEPTLKIREKPFCPPSENKWELKPEDKKEPQEIEKSATTVENVQESSKKSVLPERRSRRISKETKSSTEFIIDDPLILVDELWSDLDSDSDSSKKKSKKGKKKSLKKKSSDEKRISDVNLEELLRNFGEKKENSNIKSNDKSSVVRIKIKSRKFKTFQSVSDIRKRVETCNEQKSYKRLSLKLFRFNKSLKNFGTRGEKLSDVKKVLEQKQKLIQKEKNHLPDLPFLATEIKENPIQVIQCGIQKPKSGKKGIKKLESKCRDSNIRLKISLPLDSIDNMAVFNNNNNNNNNNNSEILGQQPVQSTTTHLATLQVANENEVTSQLEELPLKDIQEVIFTPVEEGNESKNKSKRSEVIDKIFCCEICKTYYYSSSQLKIHKLSNRHKIKESEFLSQQESDLRERREDEESDRKFADEPILINVDEPCTVENTEVEKMNDDTLEMPTLEGPFIENPITRVSFESDEQGSEPPVANSFGFSQESLKDIQRAIGCTDEEMLILTLLGENTIEIENDILDLDNCKPDSPKIEDIQEEKPDFLVKEKDKVNVALELNLKQRMTSALACLVNKAVFNLLQKYQSAAKSAVNPEALSFLGKLSSLSRRKNILQLNELLKKHDGDTFGGFSRIIAKKEPVVTYKYQCTICGSRFEKASTRECHISRSHRGKAKKLKEEPYLSQTPPEEDWNDSWSYETNDDNLGSANTSQFWCSDCGINFTSPHEVLEHQKQEHQPRIKQDDSFNDAGPLQSSTIGSSDEIIEGKKARRRQKLYSSEELDQQRIIANNELRKLDRKFSNKSKANKPKWGMEALKFTVEKENKVVDDKTKEMAGEESEKSPVDIKNIDLVPKLNLSRTSSIPEFKVIQKNSFENRFQKIIDNKLKRKSILSQQEGETDDVETEVMLVPVVVKKKHKKQKSTKFLSNKKEEVNKPLDIYDFNESESDSEPVVFSHVKKPVPSPTKLKLVKVKEGPSKNKADSTTKDLAPDDYDSEDSLPLSLVKKFKPEDEDEDKDEKISEDGVEKSEGILEQVEYLIEQLEHETGSSNKKAANESDTEIKSVEDVKFSKNEELKEDSSVESLQEVQESLRVSVANRFIQLENIPLKNANSKSNDETLLGSVEEKEKIKETPKQEERIIAEPETSHSTFDEEDSMPLVLMSKKIDESKTNEDDKKFNENTTDVSTTASEDVHLFRDNEDKSSDSPTSLSIFQAQGDDSSLPNLSSSENEEVFGEKFNNSFETLNGNVIYCRNDSVSDFGSDLSNDGLIVANYDKSSVSDSEKNCIEEVTEKEDVVIVCSKRNDGEDKVTRKKLKLTPRKKKENLELSPKRKKRIPLLTATIEENNFRKSESPKLNKELIVRKIWSKRKLIEESSDNDEDSLASAQSEKTVEDVQNDETQTEVEKEVIVKKIWNRKKIEHDDDIIDKIEENFDDVKINQTEISNEIVIKCGPKAKVSSKRRKSRSSTGEASKETIMRKIWSNRCTFQTKAALKTYDSDMVLKYRENESVVKRKPKKRGRPSVFSPSKRSKIESEADKDDEDDLDSLLEEIEREQLEKAIRSEFLQLRRSEKANVEILKEGSNSTVGLFTESSLKHKKEVVDKKRKKIRKNIRHPRRSVLQRKKFVKKPIRRVRPSEETNSSENTSRTNFDLLAEHSENSRDRSNETFDVESKLKSRKHKKHRHKRHHHKHKHKKSKHHKCVASKHKSKRKFESGEGPKENADSFTILEKICQNIPSQIESEMQYSKPSRRKSSADPNTHDSKIDSITSPFLFESKTKACPEAKFDDGLSEKQRFENGQENIYEFIDDGSHFPGNGLRNLKM